MRMKDRADDKSQNEKNAGISRSRIYNRASPRRERNHCTAAVAVRRARSKQREIYPTGARLEGAFSKFY